MKNIKVKLEKSDHLKEYLIELERWEDEGGSSTDLHRITEDIELPLKPGDTFEVMDGKIVFEDDHYFYEISLKLLPKSKGID